MEQTTEQDEKRDEIPQEVQEIQERKIHQKHNPKKHQTTPLQEEPIITRREKYNLPPNPNPNYSGSYRY